MSDFMYMYICTNSLVHVNHRTTFHGVESPVELTDATHSTKTIGKTSTMISNGGYKMYNYS